MDDTAAPWRALETGPGPAAAEPPNDQRWLAAAGLVAAVALAVVAYLIASGSSGELAVSGGDASPVGRRSGFLSASRR